MSLRNNPVTGMSYFLRGFGIIWRPGLRRYVLAPLLVNVILFAGLIWFGSDQIIDWAQSQLPGWLDWLTWLLVPLFLFVALAFSAFLFNMVANLIASPFNGLLAEAVERELTGKTAPGDSGFRKMVAEIGHTLASEVRKLAYIIAWGIPVLILMIIPGVNVIGSFLWLLFSAWMLAVAYVDYPMANHGLHFAEQRARLRDKRWISLGFGGTIMFALAIPVINFLIVPWAVAGATLMWVEEHQEHRGPPARLTQDDA